SRAVSLDADFGPELTFGYPAATLFPGDDDTQEVPFPAGFPFFGTTYGSVWVNTDGNITFGEPEFSSSARDKARHALGPPRVSAFLHDWNAHNAFNPAGSGTIHAEVKSGPDRLVATWNGVADFDGGISSTFQVTLYATGSVEVTFANLDPASTSGVVGIAEGRGHGPFQAVDLDAPSRTLDAGAVMEAFSTYTEVSDQETAREFYRTHPAKFDFLAVTTDLPVDGFLHSSWIGNQTHGISTPLNGNNGQPIFPNTVYDFTAANGSAGELEQIVFMNNVNWVTPDLDWLVNPPVRP